MSAEIAGDCFMNLKIKIPGRKTNVAIACEISTNRAAKNSPATFRSNMCTFRYMSAADDYSSADHETFKQSSEDLHRGNEPAGPAAAEIPDLKLNGRRYTMSSTSMNLKCGTICNFLVKACGNEGRRLPTTRLTVRPLTPPSSRMTGARKQRRESRDARRETREACAVS
jgi:hypothetical protein